MAFEIPETTLASVHLVGRSDGAVKTLSGFRKDRHTVPDAANATTQAFLAKLAETEIAEEAERLFQQTRTALSYKRRDLSLDLSAGTATLTARDFVWELAYALSEENPSRYDVTRTLHSLRSPSVLHLAEFNALWDGVFSSLLFSLAKSVAVEAIIDAVEDLPETAVTALEKRTEGWIASLQMAALSLQGRTDVDRFINDFSGSHRYIFDYLTEEVLAGQTAEIRDFLLQTAVLDRLCAPLCDALLEASKSQHILEQLEAANLFLMPLDDARHWYRYHQLFADLLRQQLRRERPEYESLLHHRASYWFEQASFTDEAIQHALVAADYERAASLVAEYSQSLVNHGEMNKLLSWINRLPTEWQRRHPHLIFNHASALLFHSSAQEMEATLSHMPDAVTNSLPYSAYLLVLRCIAATRQGQTDEAIALAEKAEEQLAALEPNQINQSMRGVGALVLANQYRARDGKRAGHLYDTAVSLSREFGNLIAFLTAVRDRGRFLLEQGQLHQAEAVFREGIQSEQQWAGKLGSPNKKLLAAAPIHASLAVTVQL